MNNISNNNKSGFINLVHLSAENDSVNNEAAIEYLTSEGVDVDKLVSDGVKKVRQMQLRIQAQKTRAEMVILEPFKNKAVLKVNELLQDINFSFSNFVETKQLSLQNRNLESFSEEDIRNTMIQYYTLYFFEQEK